MQSFEPPEDISRVVSSALAEDIGAGDLTAQLLDPEALIAAEVRSKSPTIVCGRAWFDEVFRQLDPGCRIVWHFRDGQACPQDSVVCELRGPARAVLTGERTALNFLQTLSGTATATRAFCTAIADTNTRILDTRKTIPNMRRAQKYAVRCGGGLNHRVGLFDAVLIKENHVAAAGGISTAVSRARELHGDVMIEVEVESLEQLREALATSTDRIMLDEFSLQDTIAAVDLRNSHTGPRKALEASGNVSLRSIREIAQTGVDYISIGAITKNLQAADYSMRFTS